LDKKSFERLVQAVIVPRSVPGPARSRSRGDHDTRADRHRMQQPGDLDHQPAHPNDAPANHDAVEFADLLGERLDGADRRRTIRAKMVTPRAPILTLYLPGPLIIASSLGAGGLARPERRGESTESVTANT
jgi:hypothetical protein